MDNNYKVAIVTGASSGLGREFTKLIATMDEIDKIFVLSRNKDKLNELVSDYGDKIVPYPIDLSIAEKIKEFGDFIRNQNVDIKILVNNAGFAKFCSYNEISLEESLNMINLNVS